MRLPLTASATEILVGAIGQASPNSVDSVRVASGTVSPMPMVGVLMARSPRAGSSKLYLSHGAAQAGGAIEARAVETGSARLVDLAARQLDGGQEPALAGAGVDADQIATYPDV